MKTGEREAKALLVRILTAHLLEPGLPEIDGYSIEFVGLPDVVRLKVWARPRYAAYEFRVAEMLRLHEAAMREYGFDVVRGLMAEVQPKEAGAGAAWGMAVNTLGLPREMPD